MISNFLKLWKAFLKESIESILRNSKTFLLKKRYSSILSELKRDGISFKKDALSQDECCLLIQEIDSLIDTPSVNVWRDEQGSDERIYFAETISEKFKDIFENDFSRRLLREYTGIRNPVGFVLASRVSYKEKNQGSGGGWHRDSPFTHQFKTIYFLEDVVEENGPFQYIKGSHKKSSVILSYCNGLFAPGQFRFSDKDIDRYLKHTRKEVASAVVKKGTIVFADTKGIHRGKPLQAGHRYAIFCYYWDNKIPPHFDKLRQASGNSKRNLFDG